MRKGICVFLVLVLILGLGMSAGAAGWDHMMDEADLLSASEEAALNSRAKAISQTYGIGVYMMTVTDYRDYGTGWDVFDTAWEIYHDRLLGEGPDRQGMLLLISMDDRDFATFFYGADTQYAFDEYGQMTLEDYFLPGFGSNDWYDGFAGYLDGAEDYLTRAAAGDPVREDNTAVRLIFVLVAVLISAGVTGIMWMGMKNVYTQHNAANYVSASGIRLTQQRDIFINRTHTRRKIPQNNGSSSSGARVGGGGSGRSGKF